jgi:hypothetical protein
VAYIFSVLKTALSTVEDPALQHWGRTHRTVRTGFVGQLARSLQSDNKVSLLEPIPELKEFSYSSPSDTDAFTAFIVALCLIAGHPVTMLRR